MDGTSFSILYKISKVSEIKCISLKIGKEVDVEELKKCDFFEDLYIKLVPLLREVNINNLLNKKIDMSYEMKLVDKETVELSDFMKMFIDGREYQVVDVFLHYFKGGEFFRFYPTAFFDERRGMTMLDEITYDVTGLSEEDNDRINYESREVMTKDFVEITGWKDGLLEEFNR